MQPLLTPTMLPRVQPLTRRASSEARAAFEAEPVLPAKMEPMGSTEPTVLMALMALTASMARTVLRDPQARMARKARPACLPTSCTHQQRRIALC